VSHLPNLACLKTASRSQENGLLHEDVRQVSRTRSAEPWMQPNEVTCHANTAEWGWSVATHGAKRAYFRSAAMHSTAAAYILRLVAERVRSRGARDAVTVAVGFRSCPGLMMTLQHSKLTPLLSHADNPPKWTSGGTVSRCATSGDRDSRQLWASSSMGIATARQSEQGRAGGNTDLSGTLLAGPATAFFATPRVSSTAKVAPLVVGTEEHSARSISAVILGRPDEGFLLVSRCNLIAANPKPVTTVWADDRALIAEGRQKPNTRENRDDPSAHVAGLSDRHTLSIAR
jgi:hypothetical protein